MTTKYALMVRINGALKMMTPQCYSFLRYKGEGQSHGVPLGGSPEASAGPLGRWETMTGERDRHTMQREFGHRVCLVDYGREGEGGEGETGRRMGGGSACLNRKGIG